LRGRAGAGTAYGTLRHWGTLDAIAGVLVRKPIADPLLRSLVAVALYQLDHARAPAFAVVDRALFAAGALVRPGARRVNALLRRYLRERDDQ
jgi:16S rRNA (cytosine967-C5)-methyltransferase